MQRELGKLHQLGIAAGFSTFFVYIGDVIFYIYEGHFVYIGNHFRIYRRVLRYIYPGIYPAPGGNFFVYIGKRVAFDFSSKNQKGGCAAVPLARRSSSDIGGKGWKTAVHGLKCRGGRAVRIPRGS